MYEYITYMCIYIYIYIYIHMLVICVYTYTYNYNHIYIYIYIYMLKRSRGVTTSRRLAARASAMSGRPHSQIARRDQTRSMRVSNRGMPPTSESWTGGVRQAAPPDDVQWLPTPRSSAVLRGVIYYTI